MAYTVSMSNNISQLGVTQANDIPTLGYSADLRWQPTTGEFGARNGLADFEFHETVATQFGSVGDAGAARGEVRRWGNRRTQPRSECPTA